MVSILRAATEGEHRSVDDAYAAFDLSGRQGYGLFLQAHARVLPSIEEALEQDAFLPAWTPRACLLADDLDRLGVARPDRLATEPPSSRPAAFGMQYVVQGSRLGGRLLARRVGEGLPLSYLSAGHGPGEWRAFLAQLAEAVAEPSALAEATDAARRTFAAFREAARLSVPARHLVAGPP